MSIPQFVPLFNREKLAKEINNYILNEDGYFMEFKKTKEFEQKLAEYLNVKYCSCVPNGTIALSLALLANGVKAGDNVLIPNITMMSTQTAVEFIGAIPIFIDIDPLNLCMDLEDAKKYIDKIYNIKALIYVTLNGRSHDVKELSILKKLCYDNKVAFIEDNAQSFGSCYNNNKKISALDAGIGCFSLSVAKAITTGQGGFMVTNNDALGGRIKRIKDLGRENGGHDLHDEFGINAKFTELSAILGLNQLEDIDKIVEKKKKIYNTYYNELAGTIKMFEPKDHETIWFIDAYTEQRDELQAFLKEMAISSRKIYPALTSQEVNKGEDNGNMIISNAYAKQGLWLPSSLNLTKKEIIWICDNIKEFINE